MSFTSVFKINENKAFIQEISNEKDQRFQLVRVKVVKANTLFKKTERTKEEEDAHYDGYY